MADMKRKLIPLCTLLLIVLFWCAGASAAPESIEEITVTGNRRVESPTITAVIKLKPGEQFVEQKVDDDIKAIYSLGFFDDVKAEKNPGAKGIILTYRVTEKPVVREINFEGNKAVGTEKLREALTFRQNSIFSTKEMMKSIEKMRKLYVDEGYSQVVIDPVKEAVTAHEMKLTFKFTDGDKILIREIRFEGNKSFDSSKLRSLMETKQSWWLGWLTGAGVYKEDVLKNDMLLLTEHYMNNGFINFKVAEPKVELTADKKALLVLIILTEGVKFTVGQIDFKGDLLETKEQLAKRLKMKTGDQFSRGVLRQEIFAFTDVYADMGYAFANVNPVTKVDSGKNTIDIIFDFEKGEKVYIDRINIAGNPKTKDKVIRREMRIAEGELYNATALKKSKQNLMNLGFFEEATIASAKARKDNSLNLDVNVKEKPTGTFTIGGGYSSIDGFVAQGSVQQSNLLGYGLKANLSASLGGKASTYSIGVTDPHFLDTNWSLGGDIYQTEREFTDYTKKATGGNIKTGYQLTDSLSTFMLYKYEEVKIFDESEELREARRQNPDIVYTTNATTSAILASLTRNTTDYRLDPSTGMTNSLSVEFAGLGGTTRYLRYTASAAQFFPVGFGAVLCGRATFGQIQELGKDLSVDDKFYLGGISTIRGYQSRTVSPYVKVPDYDVVDGTVPDEKYAYVGGDTEAYANLELTIPLLKDAGLKGVLFYDIGNAADGVGDTFSNMLSSYGFGIRWFSPIGPLRLEYGIPLNPRTGIDKSGGRLEFSIGSFF